MVIFTPILAPMAGAFSHDSVHWALLMVMAMNVGGITPPVGTNLFIAAAWPNVRSARSAIACPSPRCAVVIF